MADESGNENGSVIKVGWSSAAQLGCGGYIRARAALDRQRVQAWLLSYVDRVDLLGPGVKRQLWRIKTWYSGMLLVRESRLVIVLGLECWRC